MHIIISVKDFRAILQHAQITSGELATSYSNPGRPMKLSYGADGVLCEFILMTVGEKDAISQRHKTPKPNATKAGTPRPQLDSTSHRASSAQQTQPPQATKPSQSKMPSGARPPPEFDMRPPPPPPPTAPRSPGLFVTQDGDDDRQWEPVNPEEEEEEEEEDNVRLEWHTNSEPVCLSLPFIAERLELTFCSRIHPLFASAVFFASQRNRTTRRHLIVSSQASSRLNDSQT